MKAIILAGGYARRLWPLTLDKPKPLLPIGDKPIIDFVVEDLENISEIDSIFISTNKKFEKQFEEWSKNRSDKIKIAVEETRNEDEKLGCIKPIQQIIDKDSIEDDCLVLAGDNLFEFSIKEFINEAETNPLVALYDIKDISKCSKYGVLSIDDNKKIIDFQEKPENPKSTLISMCCYFFPKDKLSLFSEYLSQENPPKDMGSFIEWMHKKEEVKGFVSDKYWYDIGDTLSYIEANSNMLKGNTISKGKLLDSDVSDSSVGANSLVKNSDLKNCIVFDNVEINNCKLKNCIVDSNSKINNLNLHDSLVGSHTKLDFKRK